MKLNIFSFLFLLKKLYTIVLQNSLSEQSQLINHNFNFLVDLNDSGNFISAGLKENFFLQYKSLQKKLEIRDFTSSLSIPFQFQTFCIFNKDQCIYHTPIRLYSSRSKTFFFKILWKEVKFLVQEYSFWRHAKLY